MKSRSFLRENRVPLILLFLLLAAIGFLRIRTNSTLAGNEAHWKESLPSRITQLSADVQSFFGVKQNEVLRLHRAMMQMLQDSMRTNPASAEVYLKTIAAGNEKGVCYELLDQDTALIAWKEDTPVLESEIRTLLPDAGSTFFKRTPLMIWLSVLDRIENGKNTLFLITSYPIERKYSVAGTNIIGNLSTEVEKKFLTECRATYTPSSLPAVDGRFIVVPLKNNHGKEIGSLQVKKPSPQQEAELLLERNAVIVSVLGVIAFLLLWLILWNSIISTKTETVAGAALLVFLAALRWIMFILNVPAYFFPDSLKNPEFFASKFGGGIVKSPVEFLLSMLVLFIACVWFFRQYNHKRKADGRFETKSPFRVYLALLLPVVFTVLIIIRGYAASIKSVIFDSSLRYYNEPSILPQFPHLVMNVCVFLLGLSVFLMLILLFGIHAKLLLGLEKKQQRAAALSVTGTLLIGGYVFLVVQKDPLLSYSQLLVALLLIGLGYLVTHKLHFPTIYLIPAIGFFSSISVVMFMTIFNSDLELDSLKTTAAELQRPKPEFTQFILTDLLNEIQNNEEVISALKNDIESLSSQAFLLWNRSALVEEHIPAYIGFVGKNKAILGEFEAGIQRSSLLIDESVYPEITGIEITPEETDENEISGITGVAPVSDSSGVIGYCFIEVSLLENTATSGTAAPPFQTKKRTVAGILPIENLSVVKLQNDKVIYSSGDLLYGEEILQKLKLGPFDAFNEMWFRYAFGNESYVVYAQKLVGDNGTEVVSAALKERDIEWSFFNFFKLFIIHAAILILFYIFLALFRLSRQRSLNIPFRSQLLTAFISVSVIPVVVLAFYNHYNIEDKSTLAIRSSLTNQLLMVEKRLRLKVKEGLTIDQAFEQCGKELGVHFSVYRGNKLLYASRWNLYQAGVLPDRLPIQADLHLNYMANKEYFAGEETALLNSLAFYREISLRSPQPYILCVNSAFNYVAGAFSPVENDVFLFGIYSMAIFFIIALSSLLAERIARPIRVLTKATQSVAKGDLNIAIENHERGEIRDLINGFNTMTGELQRAQSELAIFERESAWKDFARQVAHEIKNPLTPMKLTIQQLMATYRDKSPNFDVIFQKVTTTVLNQIETLNQIASEFSRYARMPGALYSKIDLLEVLQETVTLFQNEKIAIRLTAGDLATAMINGDASQLRRSFINFVRNSIEAKAKSIEFSIREQDEQYVISVSDDGAGVAGEMETKIFEKSFTTKTTGMGLGLSIAKRSIENGGGSIVLDSTVTKGATFIITYPKSRE